jgi:hypothetical protein
MRCAEGYGMDNGAENMKCINAEYSSGVPGFMVYDHWHKIGWFKSLDEAESFMDGYKTIKADYKGWTLELNTNDVQLYIYKGGKIFAVVYGAECNHYDKLDFAMTCVSRCITHSLQCSGKLNNYKGIEQ